MIEEENVEEVLPETHVLLRIFNDLVERLDVAEIGFGFTLTVNGTVISGNIISRDKWFKELSKMFSTKVKFNWSDTSDPSVIGDAEKVILDAFQMMATKLNEDWKGAPKSYVYLEDADLCLSSTGQIIKMPIWCVPIEEIDGFSIGRPDFG